jgi:hypothetical protein
MISLSRLPSLVVCVGAFCLAAAPLSAQETPQKESSPTDSTAPEPVPEAPLPMQKVPLDVPMEAFGTANPACVEWTDGCRTCARDATNNISCSTPGIACLPQDIACKKERGK